jgi:hypothetical protein
MEHRNSRQVRKPNVKNLFWRFNHGEADSQDRTSDYQNCKTYCLLQYPDYTVRQDVLHILGCQSHMRSEMSFCNCSGKNQVPIGMSE